MYYSIHINFVCVKMKKYLKIPQHFVQTRMSVITHVILAIDISVETKNIYKNNNLNFDFQTRLIVK